MLEKIKQLFKNLILWIVSIFFILTFIVYIKEIPIPSIGILIAGIMLLPPINKKIKNKLNEKNNKYLVIKNIFIVMLFLIFAVNIPSSNESVKTVSNNIANENQVENFTNSINTNNSNNDNISNEKNIVKEEKQNITNNVDSQKTNEINNTKEITNNTTIVDTNVAKNKSETIQQSKQSTDTKQENTKAVAQSKNTSNSTSSKTNNPVKNTTDNSQTVYITPTGKRYHYRSTCGGKNSSATTLNNAKARGLTPCKKCAQ